MVTRYELGKQQALYAVEHGEFSSDIIASAKNVIVIMTQDWCPQWHNMNRWIYNMQVDVELDIYELLYNKVDYYEEFMRFKENKFGNDQIPYLRYYRDGKLIRESNYVNEQQVKNLLG